MKRKIFFLIAGCIITVAALAIIQGYFIFNTYQLRAKEANNAITQEFLKLETTGKLDSINNAWMRKTGLYFKDYCLGKATKRDYKRLIKRTSDSLSQVMDNFIKKERFFEEYNVSYSNYVTSVILYRDKARRVQDVIFEGKMMLYGNNDNHSPETAASQSTWNDVVSDFGKDVPDFEFEVVSQRFYNISNWEYKILFKMWGLLVFSILLLAFVVLLFYLSIKSLIAQKRIADVKTDFINNITHEFQTPLAALDIAVKTLKDKKGLTQEQFGNSLDIINRQNKRMQKLFSQVTEVSLADGIISTVNTQPLGCDAIMEITRDFMLSQPEINITCNDNGTTVLIDRFHLTTILINLLDNAVKYGADSITIDLSTANGMGVLSVADNGIGIPAKEQKAIFEKFYRVEKGNIHTTKGLGLGLFYIQHIVKAYGGYITVNSNGIKGSQFILTLPQ